MFQFLLFASVLYHLFESFFIIYFDWCYEWNDTPSHLHCFHYLDSVDILGACGDDGEVDNVWKNVRPKWLLLVFKTHFSGPVEFYLVPNRITYSLLWYFFNGWFHLISPLWWTYLSAWEFPVAGGPFTQGWI